MLRLCSEYGPSPCPRLHSEAGSAAAGSRLAHALAAPTRRQIARCQGLNGEHHHNESTDVYVQLFALFAGYSFDVIRNSLGQEGVVGTRCSLRSIAWFRTRPRAEDGSPGAPRRCAPTGGARLAVDSRSYPVPAAVGTRADRGGGGR